MDVGSTFYKLAEFKSTRLTHCSEKEKRKLIYDTKSESTKSTSNKRVRWDNTDAGGETMGKKLHRHFHKE